MDVSKRASTSIWIRKYWSCASKVESKQKENPTQGKDVWELIILGLGKGDKKREYWARAKSLHKR